MGWFAFSDHRKRAAPDKDVFVCALTLTVLQHDKRWQAASDASPEGRGRLTKAFSVTRGALFVVPELTGAVRARPILPNSKGKTPLKFAYTTLPWIAERSHTCPNSGQEEIEDSSSSLPSSSIQSGTCLNRSLFIGFVHLPHVVSCGTQMWLNTPFHDGSLWIG